MIEPKSPKEAIFLLEISNFYQIFTKKILKSVNFATNKVFCLIFSSHFTQPKARAIYFFRKILIWQFSLRKIFSTERGIPGDDFTANGRISQQPYGGGDDSVFSDFHGHPIEHSYVLRRKIGRSGVLLCLPCPDPSTVLPPAAM
jgi:hypothetical protein